MLQAHNVEQNTQEWRDLRAGIVTASALSVALRSADKKTREDYMFHLVGERFTGDVEEGFYNKHMARGHEQEDEAIEAYQEQTGCVVERVGFFTNHEELFDGEPVGYSPDACADDGLVEVKTRTPGLQARLLYEDKIPCAHFHQIQGGLWITGKPWLDFVSHCRGMPTFIKRAYPDLKTHEDYARSLRDFYRNLNEIMAEIISKAA
jgi:hypothetical protein